MGWLLWGLSEDPLLRQELILKGGSALRKLYFPDTRFSDDLDFTTRRNLNLSIFRDRLGGMQESVAKASGIVFESDRTRVEEKMTPDPGVHALDGRVYFRGVAGDSSMTFRVKFDVSPYERIVLPVQERSIIHPFSDSNECVADVNVYSLEEILAEKLRSWIQRTRARDLFDVAKIVQSGRLPVSKLNILSAFMQKTVFKAFSRVRCASGWRNFTARAKRFGEISRESFWSILAGVDPAGYRAAARNCATLQDARVVPIQIVPLTRRLPSIAS